MHSVCLFYMNFYSIATPVRSRTFPPSFVLHSPVAGPLRGFGRKRQVSVVSAPATWRQEALLNPTKNRNGPRCPCVSPFPTARCGLRECLVGHQTARRCRQQALCGIGVPDGCGNRKSVARHAAPTARAEHARKSCLPALIVGLAAARATRARHATLPIAVESTRPFPTKPGNAGSCPEPPPMTTTLPLRGPFHAMTARGAPFGRVSGSARARRTPSSISSTASSPELMIFLVCTRAPSVCFSCWRILET